MNALKEILTKDKVLLQADVADWEEAVRLGAKLLEDAGATEPRYAEAIIRFTGEMGPYYVIAPGLAMPHARPEDGVLETCLSLITLKKPVNFGSSNDPVDILVTLAAKDNTGHIEALRQVATVFSDSDTFSKIREAVSHEQLIKLL